MSHPTLRDDADLLDRLQELVPFFQGSQTHGSLCLLRTPGRVKCAALWCFESRHDPQFEMDNLAVRQGLADITPHWLTAALRSDGVLAQSSIAGYSAETIVEGTRFMNRLFRLRLDYDRDDECLPGTVIPKLPSADPLLRSISDDLDQNRREAWFYRELGTNPYLPAHHCYFGGLDATTGNTVLLLEDMGRPRQGDSVSRCSIAEAQRVVTQLARFQASLWESSRLACMNWAPLRCAEAEAYRAIYPDAWRSLIRKQGVACLTVCVTWETA